MGADGRSMGRQRDPLAANQVIVLQGFRHHAAVAHLGLAEAGFDVHRTRDFDEGARAAEADPAAPILVDWEFGTGGALVFLGGLERRGLDPQALVMGLAGNVAAEVAALEHGADYLAVPHDVDVLVARVRALQARAVARPVRKVVGHLVVEGGTRLAFVEGQPCRLTGRQTALLFRLLESLGQIVTREEIIRSLGWVGPSKEHNLDQQVANLRGKLGVAASQLQTVRGVGFRMVAERGLAGSPRSGPRKGLRSERPGLPAPPVLQAERTARTSANGVRDIGATGQTAKSCE